MSSSRQIFNLAVVNVAITAVGVITTTFTAWYFGASREMDIWFAASACQQIILGLVQTGQLSEIFLPEYIRLRETKGREEAFACYSVVLNWAVLGALLLIVIGYFLSAIITGWIGAGFTSTEKTFLQAIFVGLLPLLPLQVAAGIQQMLGNAERWFGRFEIPVLVGSIISLFLIILGHAVLGIWCLVISQWCMQIIALFGRAWQLRQKDFHHAWILHQPGFKPHAVFAQLGHTMVYILATQTFAIRFKALLTLLPPGSLSVYGYAETVYARTSSLFLRPVSTVFFTHVAEALAQGGREVKQLIHKALDQYLTAYFLLMCVIGPSIVHFLSGLWGGPRFTEESINQTAAILSLFFIAQILQAQAMVNRKLNIALGKINFQYWGNTLVQVGMIFIAPFLIIRWGIWGAAFIPLVNTLGIALANMGVTYYFRRDLVATFSVGQFTRWLLAFTPASLIGYWIANILYQKKVFSISSEIRWDKLAHLISGGVGAGVALLLCLVLIKPDVLKQFFNKLKPAP